MTIPLVNGVEHAFCNVEIHLNGNVYRKVKEVNYSDKLEPSEVRGTPAYIVGLTTGDYSCEASLTVFKSDWDLMEADLTALMGNQDGYGMVYFNTLIQYSGFGIPGTSDDEIHNARITNVENAYSQGPDPLAIKLTLKPLFITRNGRCLVPTQGSIVQTSTQTLVMG